ncbi:hypothetical protein C8241_13755, partial [Paracidovorax avenae]
RVRQAAAAGDSVVYGDATRLQALMARGRRQRYAHDRRPFDGVAQHQQRHLARVGLRPLRRRAQRQARHAARHLQRPGPNAFRCMARGRFRLHRTRLHGDCQRGAGNQRRAARGHPWTGDSAGRPGGVRGGQGREGEAGGWRRHGLQEVSRWRARRPSG